MGIAMKGAMKTQALFEATQKLLKGMPDRPKSSK